MMLNLAHFFTPQTTTTTMDPDTFLPLATRLNTSERAYETTETLAAHLMPFSIEYNGPAPVDTYLVLHKSDEKATEPVDLQADTEAVSAFRGRKIHGTKLQLPKNYTLGFFHMREEEAPADFNAAPKSTRTNSSVSAVTAPPAPVRGSRFTLDDDEDEDDDEGALDHTDFHDYPSTADEPEEISAGPEPLAWAKHGLHPVASAGNSLWVWGPDGPIDSGDDAYIRTCNEWLTTIAPVVRYLR